MEKKMTILSIIGLTGLILGATGLGFGIFNSIQGTAPPTILSTYNFDGVKTDPIDTLKIIPECNLTFGVTGGDTVYLTYSGIATVWPNGAISSIHIWFFLDGIIYSQGYAYLGSNATNYFTSVSITLNTVIQYASAGFHNVTVEIEGNFINNTISHHFLCVQVYHA